MEVNQLLSVLQALDMRNQTLDIEVGKLGEWWDEVQDMFKDDLQ
jgi:hypothetical protein